MNGSAYRYEEVRLDDGMRLGLVVRRSDGVPLDYENLFITAEFFKESYSIYSIKAVAYILKHLADVFDFMSLDIYSRFKSGNLLKDSEYEVSVDWLFKSTERLHKERLISEGANIVGIRGKRIQHGKTIVVVSEDLVSPETAYNRINVVAQYLVWLAKMISPASEREILRIKIKLESKLPLVSRELGNNENFKSLEKHDKTKMLQLVEPNSFENPWKDDDVKHRNRLIVHLLLYVGCRKGELLSIKIEDINPGNQVLRIIKKVNDEDDTRKNPALAKTLSRDIEISEELHYLILDYITSHRSKVKGSNKCPYLFISHQKGTKKAKPLSLEAVNKIFSIISDKLGINAFPHALRHTWNDSFSEEFEPLINSDDVSSLEDLRSKLMGWKPGSGTAKTYTKRYQQKLALKFGLHLQKKVRGEDKENLDVWNTDVPF